VGFVLFYSALAIVDVALLIRVIRQGPPAEEPSGRHPFAPPRPRVA
jgi:cytochrome bd-type quinol oxidase subunit 1